MDDGYRLTLLKIDHIKMNSNNNGIDINLGPAITSREDTPDVSTQNVASSARDGVDKSCEDNTNEMNDVEMGDDDPPTPSLAPERPLETSNDTNKERPSEKHQRHQTWHQ